MDESPLIFEAIGTHWQIDVNEPVSAAKREDLAREIHARIETFDRVYSRFRGDSLVSDMARAAGDYRLPDDAKPLFDLYRKVYDLTAGKFTPLIGQTLIDAGYDASYSLKSRELRRPPRWDEALEYRFPDLKVKKPVMLDFGAAGKGYLIDIVGGILERRGIGSYCIDAGQDILYRDAAKKELRVGLEDPANLKQVIGVARITGGSICGSAGNRRSWAGFHHIIDPMDLASPQHLAACWAIADSALIADAMTTAMFFVPPRSLRPHFKFEFLCLYPDNSVERSDHFPAELFTA